MFWRKEKEAAYEVNQIKSPVPDISEPIRSFIKASYRWKIEVSTHSSDWRTETLTDPETGLALTLTHIYPQFGRPFLKIQPEWVTDDEKRAVYQERLRLRDIARRKEKAQAAREEAKPTNPFARGEGGMGTSVCETYQ